MWMQTHKHILNIIFEDSYLIFVEEEDFLIICGPKVSSVACQVCLRTKTNVQN